MRNYLKFICLSLLTLTVISCKNEKPKGIVDPEKLPIPNACEMVSDAWIKDNLKLNVKDISIREANSDKNKFFKSCFFQWEESADNPNAGILIQIQTNSVYKEFPEFIAKSIEAKRTDGEMMMDSPDPVKFQKFDVGLDGAYSYAMKRFYWRIDDNYLFMLAFNIDMSEEEMVDKAETIAEEVTRNFEKTMY